MTGLAKICKHVAAILFWSEILVKVHFSKAVTAHKAHWLTSSNSTSLLPHQKFLTLISGLPS